MTTRRVRSLISARRSAISWSSRSVSASCVSGVDGTVSAGCRTSVSWPWPLAAGSTTSLPWTMFMPQANPNSPGRSGRKRDLGLRVGREGLVDAEVRENDPGCALTALLAVEHDPQRNALAHAHHVGRVAPLDRDPHLLGVADQLRHPCLLGPEEEPTETGGQ